jgi:hypothetical protein
MILMFAMGAFSAVGLIVLLMVWDYKRVVRQMK